MAGNKKKQLQFWQDLKRRQVIHVSIVYISAALVILEALNIIFPQMTLSDWRVIVLIFLLFAGLVIAIVLSWIYDITPEGVIKTRPLLGEEPDIESEKHKGLNMWKMTTYVGVGIIVAVVVFHVVTIERRIKEPITTDPEDVVAAVDKEQVYLVVENMPRFEVEGYGNFKDYIKHEIRYPENAAKERITGRVYVKFVIRIDGSVDDVTIVQGLNEELNTEAIRVIQSSPKWKPGIHKGEKVNVAYSFPVVFSLE